MVSQAAGFDDDPGTQIYQDVPPSSTFYPWINRLSHRGIMSGYPCGGRGERCVAPANLPYFRPDDSASRGQIAKIAVSAAVVAHLEGWVLLDPTVATFQDVPVSSPFFRYVETAYAHGVLNGYRCGAAPAGRCVPPGRKPYFLPDNHVTRGEASKIVANTFFPGCSTRWFK
jgi:S-layer homology domain